jgi:transposase
MGNPAGVKPDFVAVEKRRFQAVHLLEKGDLNQSEVARGLGECPQTVSRWADEFRSGGGEALKKAGRAGRKPAREIKSCLLGMRRNLRVEPRCWATGASYAIIPSTAGRDSRPRHTP